jgi:hypothetical protein
MGGQPAKAREKKMARERAEAVVAPPTTLMAMEKEKEKA